MARHFKAPVILFRDPGHSSDGAGSRYVPHRLLDRYGAGKHVVGTYLLETATAAGAIALGIFLGEALQKVFLRIP